MVSVFDNAPKLITPKFDRNSELPIVEYFHSIQGEGDDIGKRVLFIRTPLCNLRCSWCDSAYAVLGQDVTNYSHETIINWIVKDYEVDRVIWTGGEPTIYFNQIKDIYEKVVSLSQSVIPVFAFETNGTVYRDSYTEYPFMYTVSPKLGTSEQSPKLNVDSLNSFIKNTKCQFKFVVQNDLDYEQIYSLIQTLDLPTIDEHPLSPEIILQPEWFQFEQQVGVDGDFWKPYGLFMKDLTEKMLNDNRWRKYRWRVLPQMHKWLWGNIAGV